MLNALTSHFNSEHDKPVINITVLAQDDVQNVTALINTRLISFTLTDNRGFEADELELELSDHDGLLAFPKRGVKLRVSIGWEKTGLIDKGIFIVDEISFSGAPDKLTIRGSSADLRGSLQEKKERSFHQTTLGKLVKQIAFEHQLTPGCSASLANIPVAHIDQTNESDLNLLTRLSEEYDAIATIKNNTLLFMPKGQTQTLNRTPLPPAILTKKLGDNYHFSIAETDNYTAVRAYWQNIDNGTKGEVLIDENSSVERQAKITKTGKTSKQKRNVIEQTEPIETDADKIKTLRHVYKSEQAAITGAKAAFDKVKRGVASFSLTLAYGNSELIPEMPAQLFGFKPEIDSTQWLIIKVTHNLSDSGYTTTVELELKPNLESDE